MDEAVPIDHDPDMVLTRPSLKEDQVPRLRACPRHRPRCRLLGSGATRDRQSSRRVGVLDQAAAIQCFPRAIPTVDVRRAHLGECRHDNVGATAFEPDLAAAIGTGRGPCTSLCEQDDRA